MWVCDTIQGIVGLNKMTVYWLGVLLWDLDFVADIKLVWMNAWVGLLE